MDLPDGWGSPCAGRILNYRHSHIWENDGMSKKFNYTIASHNIEVHAEQDGDSRYMVRMSCAGRLANVRIGYLTGAGRKWLAEFFGSRPSVPCKSAKQACEILAKAAVKQPGLVPFFTSKETSHA